MGYLKQYPNATIPVDGSFLPSSTTDEFEFQRANNWTEVFPDAHEARPIQAPKPFLTKDPLKITCYVGFCYSLTIPLLFGYKDGKQLLKLQRLAPKS